TRRRMLKVVFFFLILIFPFDTMAEGAEHHRSTHAKLGYSPKAPQFAQFPVPTNRKGARNWISVGRCDWAPSDKAYKRLVRREAKARGPIFAGHYSIVVCSCGMECGVVSIVDLQSGKIFAFDGNSQECDAAFDSYKDFLYFRVDSTLLIHLGSPPLWKNGAERYQGCAIRYYRWTGRQLKLLKETPI